MSPPGARAAPSWGSLDMGFQPPGAGLDNEEGANQLAQLRQTGFFRRYDQFDWKFSN